jgi:dipeptidyl aminopeptidase/acylaminoacyl peptidase
MAAPKPTDVDRAVAPFGSWPSPISPDLLVRAVPDVGEVNVLDLDVWWAETRSDEDGRTTLIRCLGVVAVPEEVLPNDYSVRTRVYEYGGAAWCVTADGVYFVNDEDQCLYKLPTVGTAVRIGPLDGQSSRYADFDVRADGSSLIAVRETPTNTEPRHEIVMVNLDGDAEDRILVSGPDFVWNPRLSPDGSLLAWVQWSHPLMPWEGAELWVAGISDETVQAQRVAGGAGASVFQPEWSRAGTLYFLCEQSGWWNVHAALPGANGWDVERRVAIDAEVGIYAPSGVMGISRYCVLPDESIVFAYVDEGADQLAVLSPGADAATVIPIRFSQITQVRAIGDSVVIAGSSFTSGLEVVCLQASGSGWTEPSETVLRPPPDYGLVAGDLSTPESLRLPARDGATVHAFYYHPVSRTHTGPAGQRFPLLVMSHGGPTDAAANSLNLAIQYWTSRGFAVLDVNYRGSTGFGRAYREALHLRWGDLDVTDCLDATKAIIAVGEVDPARIAIRGGSAGGFTTLCALAASGIYAAGVSRYGVSDLRALARDTHKFESHLLDGLIGPYPDSAQHYDQRSPVFHAEEIRAPVFLVQGLEDRIVPPNQAEMMIRGFERTGTAYAYLPLKGEGHGLRKGQSIRLALESELRFYSVVFGFTPGEPLPSISMHNNKRVPQ